ncbi:UNVERIFIED_CONTAM: hypothetical protein FKN15_067071 [Acipenser sinensis]
MQRSPRQLLGLASAAPCHFSAQRWQDSISYFLTCSVSSPGASQTMVTTATPHRVTTGSGHFSAQRWQDSISYFLTCSVSSPGASQTMVTTATPHRVTTGSEIRLTLRGMEKSLPPSSPSRQPISTDLFLHLITALRQGCFNPFDDIVMETLSETAFFGLIRCVEFSTPSNPSFPALGLKRSDLSQIPRNHFILHIRSSKTDQLSQGFCVFRQIPSSSTAPDL